MKRILFFAILGLAVAITGCTQSSDTLDPQYVEYYYEEFGDVSIPTGMNVVKGETFVTYSSGGVKVGTQEFKGRIEMGALVSAMQNYMLRDGWSLRSVFRANKAIMIFEKPEKLCTLAIEDGSMSTSMLVFVSPNISETGGYSAPSGAYTETGNAGYPGGTALVQ